MSAAVAVAVVGIGIQLLSSSQAGKVQARNLRAQAGSLRANAISLRFEADQEIIKGRLDGIVANDKLNKAQASNLTRTFARGVAAGGSSTEIQAALSREADFFRAMSKVNTELTALNLRRVARAEEVEARRLEKAAEEAGKFLGIG